eukprot:TRINITY_DN21979_c0_g2_i1.p1 TRINITY_DN21979_c0_g2~~TRINITY_DN21979_c0_g2_i1.p1  ORF type:complete len:491 (-),score=92.54 TRINITY_DN21979_c0_g2_i1:61-1533(-)
MYFAACPAAARLRAQHCRGACSDAGSRAAFWIIVGAAAWCPRWTAAAPVEIPFAQAALFAAERPEVKACDGGLGPKCDNPYPAMFAWRYATNNLRLAVNALPESERRMHKSTVSWVALISEQVDAFFKQPTAETLANAVGNARQVFDSLKGWMATAAPSKMEVPDSASAGVGFLPGNRSLRVVADKAAKPAEAEVRLANGVEMPVLGFGTWQLVGQLAYEATLFALQTGYRHIDTAQAYGNEKEVGRALKESGVPRRELFVATKLSDPEDFEPQRLIARFEQQLQSLQVDYIDLYMLHSPGASVESTRAAWQVLELLYDSGVVRALGVSNFGRGELENLLSYARIPPVYVQNKFSIYNPGEQQVAHDSSLMGYLKTHGIAMMGYSVINPWPFLIPPMEDPHVLAISKRVGRTPAQVLHRWALQLGTAVIPKSGTAERILSNSQLFDFHLSEVDMRLLNGIVTLAESTLSKFAPAWVEDVYDLSAGVLSVA